MKIKGIKTESLEKMVNFFYQEHKEVIDVWQELMIAAQTDIEINSPQQENVSEAFVPDQQESVDEPLNKPRKK